MSNTAKLEEIKKLFLVNRGLFLTGVIPDYFYLVNNIVYNLHRIQEFIRIYNTYLDFESFYREVSTNENKLAAVKMIFNSGLVKGLKEAKDLYEELFENKIVQEKITSLYCYKLNDVFKFVEKQLQINKSEFANIFIISDLKNIIKRIDCLVSFSHKLSKERLTSESFIKNGLYNDVRNCLLDFVELHSIPDIFYIIDVN